ncbi:hypothetical protein FBR04_18910 [Betaproteobacteria bacterium PRO7]|nr:hypothetical protein [Betaproteobacteria bacterium PRO7]
MREALAAKARPSAAISAAHRGHERVQRPIDPDVALVARRRARVTRAQRLLQIFHAAAFLRRQRQPRHRGEPRVDRPPQVRRCEDVLRIVRARMPGAQVGDEVLDFERKLRQRERMLIPLVQLAIELDRTQREREAAGQQHESQHAQPELAAESPLQSGQMPRHPNSPERPGRTRTTGSRGILGGQPIEAHGAKRRISARSAQRTLDLAQGPPPGLRCPR